MAEAMSDERLAELDAWMGPDSLQGRLGGKGSDWAMEAELVTEVKRLNTVLDANRVVRNAAESSSRTYKAVVDRLKAERTELRAEIDRLRAQLAEIGETREEFGVRVDGCTDTIGVYPGRESAEENLALWRKVWPSSEFTLMQRENRAAVVSGWREVPDA